MLKKSLDNLAVMNSKCRKIVTFPKILFASWLYFAIKNSSLGGRHTPRVEDTHQVGGLRSMLRLQLRPLTNYNPQQSLSKAPFEKDHQQHVCQHHCGRLYFFGCQEPCNPSLEDIFGQWRIGRGQPEPHLYTHSHSLLKKSLDDLAVMNSKCRKIV